MCQSRSGLPSLCEEMCTIQELDTTLTGDFLVQTLVFGGIHGTSLCMRSYMIADNWFRVDTSDVVHAADHSDVSIQSTCCVSKYRNLS